MADTDRDLGMDRAITRRDFLSGVSVAIGGAMISPALAEAREGATELADQAPDYYPPAMTGMRGSHDGSYEVAHSIRDGKKWDVGAADTGELYDLVVVGAGLSGLAAAYYFRKALPETKVLLLDNHDDFGGTAKRNEFTHNGRTMIGYGGTTLILAPLTYTIEGKALLQDIGIDASRFYAATRSDRELYRRMGLQRAVFFDRETFGTDRLVVGEPTVQSDARTWSEFLAKTPLSDQVKKDILRIYAEKRDYLPGLTQGEKIERLRKMSYRDYLLNCVGAHPDALPYFQKKRVNHSGGGPETMSAWASFRTGVLPGFDGLAVQMPPKSWLRGDQGENIHFPDGNAGVARLLVRWLNPKAVPGHSMEDAVTTRVNYAALDDVQSPVRIRLNSTVVRVRHNGDIDRTSDVEVTYVRGGKAYRVTGASCVLACFNAIIPYLCPELPAHQIEALHNAVRKPMVFTTVLLRDWGPFYKLRVSNIYCPGSYHEAIALDDGISLGKYRCARTPEEPMVLHMQSSPQKPGLPPRAQSRALRAELLTTTFETLERKIRDQLARALVDGGFNPARDIEAITVNRWPHGISSGSNELFDPDWSDSALPWIVGRKRFGRITIANSDAAGVALSQAAFDQAHRAVQELLTDVIRPQFQYPWTERS